jgi:hypothetical protein
MPFRNLLDAETAMASFKGTGKSFYEAQADDPKRTGAAAAAYPLVEGPMPWIAPLIAGAATLGSSAMETYGRDDLGQGQLGQLTPEQAAVQEETLDFILGNKQFGLRREGGPGIEPYPGTRIPEVPGSLQEYLTRAGQYGESPMYKTGESTLSRILSGEPSFDTDLGKAEEYWDKAFYQPAKNRYQREMIPQLRENFAGFGGFRSSGREEAERRSLTDFLTNIEGQRAGLLWNELQAGRGAQESALERALQAVPTSMDYGAMPLNMMRDAGQLQYQLEQAPLEEQYQNWLVSQPWNSPYMEMGQAMMGAPAFEPYLTSTTPWYSNMSAMMANAGQTALGLYGGRALSGQLGTQQQLGSNYGQPATASPYLTQPQSSGYQFEAGYNYPGFNFGAFKQ